jgi:hypothetical protein
MNLILLEHVPLSRGTEGLSCRSGLTVALVSSAFSFILWRRLFVDVSF